MISSLMYLTIIITPIPPRIPVKNLKLLLLSLNSNNWVVPSKNAGTHSKIPDNTYSLV